MIPYENSPDKYEALEEQFNLVPAELKEHPSWMCWRRGTLKSDGVRFEKQPVSPRNGYDAAQSKPENWGTFEQAAARVGAKLPDGPDGEQRQAAGVSFVPTENDQFSLVDLDDCRNPETEEIATWAREWIDRFGSYTEVSPSGTGLRVVVRGSVPTNANRDSVEIYCGSGYLQQVTITGEHLPGTPTRINEGGEALAELYERHKPRSGKKADLKIDESEPPVVLGDYDLEVWHGEKPVLKADETPDRSATLQKIGYALAEAGASAATIRRAVAERDVALGYRKYSVRAAEGAEREYTRIASTAMRETGGKRADYLGVVGYFEDSQGVTGSTTATVTTAAARERASGLPPAARFPVESLSDIPRRLVSEGSLSTGTTPDMFATMILSTLGGAVGGSRWLWLKEEWQEFPVLWTVVVADPGDKKTPAFKTVTRPAVEQQKTFKAQHDYAMEEYKQELAEWEAKKKSTPKGQKPPNKPETPKMRHALAQDVTPEALATLLDGNPRGVFAARDELSGFFSAMNQYKAGGKGDERQKYLSLWSSSFLKVDRKGDEPIFIERPVVSVTGTIQPDLLAEIGRQGAGQLQTDDGMVHRFLYSYPEPPVILDDLTDHDISPVTKTRYRWLYDRLARLEPDANGDPVAVPLTEDGREQFRTENRAMREEMYGPGFPRRLKPTWSKTSGQLARLSLLLALIRAVTEETEEAVTGEDVGRAAEVLRYFLAHARRVHAILHQETREERMLRVLDELRGKHGENDEWKVSTEELRKLLKENGAYDAPDRAEDLTRELTAATSQVPTLSVEVARGRVDGKRALLVRRLYPGGSGSNGSSGSPVTPQEDFTSLNSADMVEFILRTNGAMFPKEIAEATGLAHGTVKKVVSQLRQPPHPRVEDTGETDEHGSNQVRVVEQNYGANIPPW